MPVTFHPGRGHPKAHGGRAYAAVVTGVGGQALVGGIIPPEKCDLELACFAPDGTIFTVWRPASEATWSEAGSPPDVDHWRFVDLS
jgi:hypothetical protein